MAERTASEKGKDWEAEFAKKVGGDEVVLSGAGFLKLDVGNRGSILWSNKWTGDKSFRVSTELFAEIDAAITAPGGIGGETVGALAIKVEPKTSKPEEVVVMRLSDFMALLATGKPAIVDAPAFRPLSISTRRSSLLDDPDDNKD